MSTAYSFVAALVMAGLTVGSPPSAAAQSVTDITKFVAGGAVGLAVHETGHVVLDLSLGTSPGLKKVTFGPLPFFAITHHAVTSGKEFAISSAGFWMQHVSSELILMRRPNLRRDHAPFTKGILAFNVLASVAYSGAAFGRVGPAERDTRGIADSARVPEPVIGATILIPAALDAARYYKPESAWLKWSSRAAKIGGALLIVKALD